MLQRRLDDLNVSAAAAIGQFERNGRRERVRLAILPDAEVRQPYVECDYVNMEEGI